jgi:hypothetical protein
MRVLFTVALFVGALTPSTTLASERDGGARLRPQDPRISLALQEGMSRSDTFLSLVNRIEASNVIVYVAVDPSMRPSLAGALTWMTSAGKYRYLRAQISIGQTFDQTIATVAHELHHAIEVIEDESVVDEKSLVALYKRIGLPSKAAGALGWETLAAQRTGKQVRRELVAMPTMTMARASDNRQS